MNISFRAQVHLVLGSFQEALGVAITQDVADLSGLNRELNFCYIYNNIIVIFIQKTGIIIWRPSTA